MKYLSQKGFEPLLAVIIIAALAIVAYYNSNIAPPTLEVPPTPTLVPTPTPTATPSSTPKPTVKPTVKPSSTPAPAPVVNNAPPGSGFSSQTVSAEGKNYKVAIVAADLNSTKVIVDTASSSDCSADCPVLSLGEFK